MAVAGILALPMVASASLLVVVLLGPPEAEPPRPTEHVDVVPIEPAPAPEPAPEPESEPEPTAAIARPEPEPEPIARAEHPHELVEPEPPRTWQAEIFVDLYYAVNSNSPDNHLMRGFITAPRSGEVVASTVGGFIRHRATDQEPWWVELGIHAGPAVDSLVVLEPVAGGSQGRFAGAEVFKHIALANLGFRIRKSKTSIGAGVFESPFGLSSFWTFRNTTYTPMWQNNIVPYYFAGARISQEIKGGLTVSAWVVNGSQTYSDAYKVPSGVASMSWSPKSRKGMKGLTLNSHVLFGPETRSIAPADWYVLWDTTLTWTFNDRFQMGFAWDYAVEYPGRAKTEQNMYTGGGILARGTVLDLDNVRLDLYVRPDVLLDRDGRFFGVAQWLVSPSVGADLALWQHLNFRVQYRYDWSSNKNGFFYRGAATTDGGPGLARQQHTVLFGLIGLWDFWFGRHKQPN